MSVNKVDKTTGNTTLIAGSTLWADSPIGSILPYGGASAPSGWFICNGSAISRTTYSELFAVIGTSFGSGDGSTTFNLPDLREATTKGVGLTGKSNNHYDSDGVALGEFVEDRIQNHGHSSGGTSVGNGSYIASASTSVGNVMSSSSVAGIYRSGDTTEVKAVGVNYIIKAKMVAMPSDFMSKVDEAVVEELAKISNVLYRATVTNASVVNASETFPITMTYYKDDDVYISSNKIKFTKSGFYEINVHLSTSQATRGWAKLLGTNSQLQAIQYGQYSTLNIHEIIQVTSATEIYLINQGTESMTVNGGSTGPSVIEIKLLKLL